MLSFRCRFHNVNAGKGATRRTDEDRDHLIGSITSHLCNAQKRIQLRQTAIFYKADPDCGRRVGEGLELDVGPLPLLRISQI